MDRARQAREEIKSAIAANGGVYVVATASDIHYTQIYAFLRGGGMKADNAGRLRLALPDVGEGTWADAFAPLPEAVEAPQ